MGVILKKKNLIFPPHKQPTFPPTQYLLISRHTPFALFCNPRTNDHHRPKFIIWKISSERERERERFSTATCPLLPPTTCNPDWSLSFLFFLFLLLLFWFHLVYEKNCFCVWMCFAFCSHWDKKEKESEEEREMEERWKNHFLFNRVIIWWENNIWSCYSNCYSALFFKRATVTTLKKKFRIREAIGRFFLCLISKIGFREPIGDALRAYQKSVIYALKINFRRLWYEV